MNRKIQKGDHGYRAARKKRQLFFIIINALIIIAFVVARNFVDGVLNILFTVSAVLAVLPLANLLAPLFASWPWHDISDDLYQECETARKNYPILYDLIITSQNTVYPMDVIVIHPNVICCYCPRDDISERDAEKYLNGMLQNWDLPQNAKVMTEENAFLRRIESLRAVSPNENTENLDYAVQLMKSLSM